MKKAIFLCTCENTLNENIDYKHLEEFSSKLSDVVHIETHNTLCSRSGLDDINNRISSIDCGGVILGACSPRKYGDFFEKNITKVKNESIHLEQANIRENGAWIHRNGSQVATSVAEVLIDIADASLSLAEHHPQMKIKLIKKALVIGGGVAGMQAALDLADSQIPTVLVERREKLGGRALQLAKTFPTSSCGICCIESCNDCILVPKPQDILTHPLITTLLHSEISDITGSFGNYNVAIKHNEQIINENVGQMIIATGSKLYNPASLTQYNYSHPDVVTSIEFNQMLINQRGSESLQRPSDGKIAKIINFVLCVGSRAQNSEIGNRHCSIVCCNYAVGQARSMSQVHPDIEIYVHYLDLRAPYRGFEDLYREARNSGVKFIRGRVAEIRELPDGDLQVITKDTDLGEILQINSDLVVLYTGQEPSTGTEILSKMVRKSLDSDGFFKELNTKLEGINNIHTRTHEKGVYVVGCARGPRGIRYSIADAQSAAMSAVEVFKKDEVSIGKNIADIDEKRCDGCAYCVDPCPFNAIKLIEVGKSNLAIIDATICESCGICQATCPKEGVHVRNYTQPQIRAKINRALSNPSLDTKILAFLCNWCGYPAADLSGVKRASYPPIIPIRVMCTGMIHPNIIIDAFTHGADGVMVFGCKMEECHYTDGNKIMDQRRKALELMMEDFGLERERLLVKWVSGRQWKTFSRTVRDFHQIIGDLGPNPIV